jgi:dolichol-phosphate mannosyltransferase
LLLQLRIFSEKDNQMYQDWKILAVAPAYNEKGKIGRVVQRIPRNLVDLTLVVDDGSDDGSAEEAEDHGATVIRLGRVMGVGAALREGIEYGIDNGYHIVVILAGNNKDDPEEIIKLVQSIVDHGHDFVQGSRYLAGGKWGNMPLYRIIATRLHPLLFSLVSGRRVTDSTNGFRAFRTSLFQDKRIDLRQTWLDEYELEPYLYFKVLRCGYRATEVPVTKIYPPKALGYTKMKPISGWWSILRPLFLLGLGLKR